MLPVRPIRQDPGDGVLNINFADITGGSIYQAVGGGNYGGLTLRDSRLTDLNRYSYIWYPDADCNIERNVFVRWPRLSIAHNGSIQVNVLNNVFA